MKIEVTKKSILFFEKTKIVCVGMEELIALEGVECEVIVHGQGFMFTFRDTAEHIIGPLETKLIRCTHCIAVNPSQIRQIKNGEVIMKNDQVFPIARQRNAEAVNAYLQYLGLEEEHWRRKK